MIPTVPELVLLGYAVFAVLTFKYVNRVVDRLTQR